MKVDRQGYQPASHSPFLTYIKADKFDFVRTRVLKHMNDKKPAWNVINYLVVSRTRKLNGDLNLFALIMFVPHKFRVLSSILECCPVYLYCLERLLAFGKARNFRLRRPQRFPPFSSALYIVE